MIWTRLSVEKNLVVRYLGMYEQQGGTPPPQKIKEFRKGKKTKQKGRVVFSLGKCIIALYSMVPPFLRPVKCACCTVCLFCCFFILPLPTLSSYCLKCRQRLACSSSINNALCVQVVTNLFLYICIPDIAFPALPFFFFFLSFFPPPFSCPDATIRLFGSRPIRIAPPGNHFARFIDDRPLVEQTGLVEETKRLPDFLYTGGVFGWAVQTRWMHRFVVFMHTG